MKLNPSQREKVRVHELARELGWTSRQLLDELRRRGEFVKSASSVLEAPVVRAMRENFATANEGVDREATVDPAVYGHSAEAPVVAQDSTETFAAAVERARTQSETKDQARTAQWRPPILQVLLEEIVIAQRPEHLEKPSGGVYFRWELKKAERLNALWAEARLNGLNAHDAEVIKWIRLSDGQRPKVAADLASCGITPEEADLRIGHGGRIDARLPTIYERYRNRRIGRSETIALTRQWRQNQRTG